MLLYVHIVSAVIFLATGTESLLLCDGDCKNNTEVEICRKTEDSRQLITLLGLFPCNSPVFRARGLTPPAQMALNQINQHSMLLPGYRLQLLINNSMVSISSLCVNFTFIEDNYPCAYGFTCMCHNPDHFWTEERSVQMSIMDW